MSTPERRTRLFPAGPERRMRFFLGAVLLGLVVHLVFGDKPWEEGIALREAEGEPVRPVDYWVSYGYWVAAAVAAVVAALLATQRRWFDADPAPERDATLPPARGPGRAWIAAVALAALVGGLVGAPRLDHSLWMDEDYNVKRSIHGSYTIEDGELEFDEIKLRNSFWEYRKPNNHVFHTLLARFALGTWELLAQPEDLRPRERWLRVPALLGGLASIVGVAVLGWLLGMPNGGAIAAWILALHPWHARYLSEARGYSIAMALVSGTLIAMVLALQRGTWARWSAYGLVQLLLLWTYPGAVYHVLFMNLLVLAALFGIDGGTPRLASQLERFLFVNLAGALFWLLLMTPNIAQLLIYLETFPKEARLERWLAGYLAHLLTGMHWTHGGLGTPEHVALEHASPALLWLWAGIAGGAFALGILRFARAGGLRTALLPVFLLPAPLFAAQSLLRGDLFYPWYAIFLLPPAALLVGAGIGWIAERSGRPGPAALGLGALALAAMLALVWPMHRMQWRWPIYAERGSVEFTRPFPVHAQENERIVTVTWSEPPAGYDPRIREIETLGELRAEMRAADAASRTLFVNLGRLDLWSKRKPEHMALLREAELFELVWTGQGSEPKGERAVWRYRPGSVDRAGTGSPGAGAEKWPAGWADEDGA